MHMIGLKLRVAVAALVIIGLANVREASADGETHRRPHNERHDHHPSYADPYAYQFVPRGYYPAYNSGYWRPTQEVRERNHDYYNDWINGTCYEQVPNYGYRRCFRRYDHHTNRFHRWHY